VWRQGGTLKRVAWNGEGAHRLRSAAMRAGAVLNLTSIVLYLDDSFYHQVLSSGMLRLLEKVRVTARRGQQIGVLENLRRLPHLRHLDLECNDILEAAFPPFIPTSLKTLCIDVTPMATLEALLHELPSMLQASGARLEEIYFSWWETDLTAEAGAALAQVLRACSPTLKSLKLMVEGRVRGTAYIPDLMPGLLSCCDTLEALECPWDVFSALPATCPTCPRLAELRLQGLSGGAIDTASPA
jgi:hypothetical protein